MTSVAIVGAGLSGLTTARHLIAAGHDVTVFEKSRGPGGRMSTRRTDVGQKFDHGAAHFGVASEAFSAVVEEWRAAGLIRPRDGHPQLFGAVAGMSAICRHLSQSLKVVPQVRIHSLVHHNDSVEIFDDKQISHGRFGHVTLAIPAPQTREILPRDSHLQQAVRHVRMQPRWVGMFGFTSIVGADRPDFFVTHSDLHPDEAFEVIRSAGNEVGSAFVVQASRRWSESHLEREPADLIELLTPIVCAALHTDQLPRYSYAHRWRYAFVDEPLGTPCLIDRDRRISVCGDWCVGWNVEAAWQSGDALGRLLVDQFSLE